jgi:hypothetical protein
MTGAAAPFILVSSVDAKSPLPRSGALPLARRQRSLARRSVMAVHSVDEDRYRRAKKRVEDLKGFYTHVAIYLIVNTGLFLINALTSDTWWFYWPMIGWGIGLAAHAVALFSEGRFGRAWEERKMRELMDDDRL